MENAGEVMEGAVIYSPIYSTRLTWAIVYL